MVIAVAKCGQVERIERQEQAECHIGPVYGGCMHVREKKRKRERERERLDSAPSLRLEAYEALSLSLRLVFILLIRYKIYVNAT